MLCHVGGMQISGANLLLASQRTVQQPFRPAPFPSSATEGSPAKEAEGASPAPAKPGGASLPGATTHPGSQVNILI
ncbi:MAG TPA: hypothetical protein VGM17_17680 [Rhizomicrobium sp.]|jgi:hypothetical protein